MGTVTPCNIVYFQELVRNGPQSYLGASYVVHDTGERIGIDLQYNKRADTLLQYSWVMEWHLKDGE
jgi:DNA-directed RNA polymerase II subunit RPB1